MRHLATLCAAVLAGILISGSYVIRTERPAEAAFHLAEISEVMVGFDGNPNVQYVEINQLGAGQTFVNTSRLSAWGPTGNYLGVVLLLDHDVPTGGTGVKWIMGTPAFETASGIQADYEFAPGILSPTGGMVCWGSFGGESNPNTHVDCVAYGNYSGTGGAAAPNGVSALPPGNCSTSLTRTVPSTASGQIPPMHTYRLSNDATDFSLQTPSPRNNLGINGSLTPSDLDGDTIDNCSDQDMDGDGWLNTCETQTSPARDPLNSGSVPMFPTGVITNANGMATASDADADHAIDACESSTGNPSPTNPGNPDSDADGVQDGVEDGAGTNPNANPADYSDVGGDDDGDGCTNAKELAADDANPAGDRHPGNFWDFYSVDKNGTPAYDPNNNIDLSDTVDLLAHFGEGFNAGAYMSPQGQGYDRTRLLSPGPAGMLVEGNNGIDLSEALANLFQFGFGGGGCVAPGPVPAQGGGIFS